MKGFFAGSSIIQKQPQHLLPQCGACGLHATCKTPKMPVYGRGLRGVLLVLPAPDAGDDVGGGPLVGRHGRYLTAALSAHGVDVERDCWTTYAAICHPGERDLTTAEVEYCKPNLRKTISTLQPHTVIPFGGRAVRAVVGDVWKEDTGSIDRWVGFMCPSQNLNAWVCPVWAPSYVYERSHGDRRHPVVSMWWHRHLEAAFSHTSKPWEVVPDWEKDVQIVLDPSRAAAMIREVASYEDGMVGFDYETNCLKPDPDYAQVLTASIAWGRGKVEKCFAYPWHGDAIKATGEFLQSPLPKIASNMKFEERWTYRMFGHRVRNWWWDTMLASHTLDCGEDITNIKFQSFALLGVPFYEEHIKKFMGSEAGKKTNQLMSQVDLSQLLLYNGLDSLLEWYVARVQAPQHGVRLPRGVT